MEGRQGDWERSGREKKRNQTVSSAAFDSVRAVARALYSHFYARVRAVWTRLVSSITEQLSRGRVWLEEEAMGSIWFLAFLNFSFLAGVAAFAAWNIEVLGGKKWSAPPIVTPEVRAAPTAKKVVFRKPQWRFPTSVRGTYSEDLSSPSKSSPLINEPDGESREGSVGTIERIRDA